MTTDSFINALKSGILCCHLAKVLIVHSDHSAQYTSQEFRAALAKYGLATLNSQEAILRAKNELLTQLESNQDFPLLFRTEELLKWESMQQNLDNLQLNMLLSDFSSLVWQERS